jgi:hypothetical protein
VVDRRAGSAASGKEKSLLPRKLRRKAQKPAFLGDLLNGYLNQPGLRSKMREQKILNAWDRVVGKAIAEVTQPARVRNRILQIRVINSVWMQELQFHKPFIIKKLNEFLGDPVLQDVRFVLGEREERTPLQREDGWKRTFRELGEEERKRIEKEVSRLPDQEMREVLSRLFAKGLTSPRGEKPKIGGGGR